MTINEQLIFVCEKLLGWKWEDSNITAYGAEQPLKAWHVNEVKQVGGLPPLTLDLIWECEEKLPGDCQAYYASHLVSCSWLPQTGKQVFRIAHATAEQRLAALVQTIKEIKETRLT